MLFAAVMALVACGGDDESPVEPLAFYPADDENAGMDALLGGVVEVSGPCFYMVQAREDSRALIAFPEGEASWDEQRQAAFLKGARLSVGAPVTISGGFTDERDFSEWPVPPDESCDTSRVWLASEVGPTVN
jgi:hypothetical protein